MTITDKTMAVAQRAAVDRPPSVAAGITSALVRLRFSRVARSEAEFPCIAIIAIARPDVGLPRVVISRGSKPIQPLTGCRRAV